MSNFLKDSMAPLETYGAAPETDFFEKTVADWSKHLESPTFGSKAPAAILDILRHKGDLDDRKMLLEVLLVAMSRREGHALSQKMQEYVISMRECRPLKPLSRFVRRRLTCPITVYKDLPHPPAGYLRLETSIPPTPPPSDIKYTFRPADGSYYNPLFPTMGQAGRPYARSVPSKHCLPKAALPDPGLVFDTLLLREKFEEHPGGISSLFFATNASSYLDLSVLYGHSQTSVDKLRRKDGTGRLWDDVFADSRLLHMPPASCALLVLMSRNHNTWTSNDKQKAANDDEKPRNKEMEAQDEEIFQRARLVNCGYFMHIILGDYVGAILGLVRDGSSWRLDPLMPIRNSSHELEPVGEGNVVSVEFNLLYRWHATLSAKDAEWTTEMTCKDVTIDDFKNAAHKHLIPDDDPKKWTFGGLKRGSNGSFSDDDLANILHNATEWRAGAFKARGIPAAMRIIEILGIQQARSWGTCSMNEFRKFVGLKRNAAESLYRDIDNLELYVGLQAEEAKAPQPGAGLCPGYTISRAILADAVCLTRGDRFFTTDFTPANLTSWGFQDCQYDTADGSYGGLLTKLLFRTLPNHYPRGSAYAHFPFLTPEFMKDNLLETQGQEIVDKYGWSRPRKNPTVAPIKTWAGVKQVLEDKSFLPLPDARIFTVAKPVVTKKLSKESWRNNEKRLSQLKNVDKALATAKDEVFKLAFADPEALSAYFAKKTTELLSAKSHSSADKSFKFVDVVHDVVNLLPVHWVSQELAGLPLKTAANPQGTWPEQMTYDMFQTVAEYVHLNFSSEHDFRLRESSQAYCEKIVEFTKEHVDKIGQRISLPDTFNHIATGGHTGHDFLKKVFDKLGKRYSHREIAAHVFAATVPSAAVWSAAVTHVLDFFLQEEGKKEATEEEVKQEKAKREMREAVAKLLESKEEGDKVKLQGYIREAIRIKPPVPGVYRTATREVVVGPENVPAFGVVYASAASANLDSIAFGPTPSAVDITRAGDKTGIVGFSENSLVSEKFLLATVPAVLGVIFEQKGLKRGAGRSGKVAAFTESWQGSPREQYISTRGSVTQFPDSLVVQVSIER
ncbi:heme peroxidase [Coprinellus micaceus]|uniref:Heme peroxidase n=1 Tax=Coprinellus micaceus TaxID=71717 RepID=A0A4Y7ST48_COPMI|nr:heme peroxidase [Coprinellus micaceus]